jgi:hypothetical protein
LAAWTTPLQLSLSAALLLHPLTPITPEFAITLSIHLFLGLPFFLLESSQFSWVLKLHIPQQRFRFELSFILSRSFHWLQTHPKIYILQG